MNTRRLEVVAWVIRARHGGRLCQCVVRVMCDCSVTPAVASRDTAPR
jgi:hypothetical protein